MTASGLTPRRTSSGRISAALPSKPDGDAAFCSRVERVDHRQRVVEDLRLRVEISCAQPHLDARGLAFDGEHRGARHDGGERLRAAHAAKPAVRIQRPARSTAIMLAAHLGEGFVRALNDSLAADIDPAAGRHLAVHHQALAIERVEMSQVAQCGTRLELAISTRGASACVRNTPTGLPDCTSSV